MLRIAFIAIASFALCHVSERVEAQAAAVPGKAIMGPVGVGVGIYSAKKCIRHPILCTAAVGGGAIAGSIVSKKVKSRTDDGKACRSGFIDLYRVMSSAEHVATRTARMYMLQPGGMEQKQFWFDINDAKWFDAAQRRMFSYRGSLYTVTSKACLDTVKAGTVFSDVGHKAVSFDSAGLSLLNKDAKANGGINTLMKTE